MLEAVPVKLRYDELLESVLSQVEDRLKGDYGVTKRAIGLLLLQGDRDIETQVREREGTGYESIQALISQARSSYSQPLSYVIALKRQEAVKHILSTVMTVKERVSPGFAERLSRAMMNPLTGFVILLVVLYFGLYQFVGVFAAGTLVGLIENTVFGEWISPWVTYWVARLIPWEILQNLFVGEYGILTMGLSYAFALILPIVTCFFIAFSIIEDSGYLPRLAMLVDRAFKVIGLNGRAVIPMVLGFGCDTMATLVTRTQETKRERLLTTLLRISHSLLCPVRRHFCYFVR